MKRFSISLAPVSIRAMAKIIRDATYSEMGSTNDSAVLKYLGVIDVWVAH